MRVRLVRRPGQHGTREYLEEYGDRLVCVRYRYDAETRRRYKTIEIIVGEAPWVPRGGVTQAGQSGASASIAGGRRADGPRDQPPAEPCPSITAQPLAPATLVGVRLPDRRPQLVAKVQRAGGEYRGLLGVWSLRYDQAVALGLTEFIVDSVERLAAAWNSQSSRRSSRS